MPIDTSMYANLQQPNTMQTLGGMVNVANGIQQQQALKNQNVQSGIDANETQNLQPILRNTQAYTDDRGNVDFNKLVPLVMSAAPKNGASVISNMATSQQQRTLAQNAIMGQSTDALQRSSNAIASIDPTTVTPENLAQTRDAINSNFTTPQAQYANTQLFNQAIKTVQATKPNDPLRATQFNHLAMMYQPIQTQQAINTPTAAPISNNQQTALLNLKPGVSGIPQGGIVPNSVVNQGLAPNTPVMGPNNTPGYLGSQGSGSSALDNPNAQKGFVPAGLPVGTDRNINNNIDQMNTHFASLQDQAQGNQLVQSLRGNILQLAQKAATGTLQDKEAYVAGLAQSLHIPGITGDLKTDTDLLDKNLSQLNMTTPASSDAARALITAARPHMSMSPQAIPEATNQIASQVEANMAIRNHLSGYKYANNGQGDSVAYQAERQNIEQVADPRLWQYQDLGAGTPAAKAFLQKQPDAQALIQKASKLQQMGVFQ